MIDDDLGDAGVATPRSLSGLAEYHRRKAATYAAQADRAAAAGKPGQVIVMLRNRWRFHRTAVETLQAARAST